MRFSLADSGDSLLDANLEPLVANKCIMKLTTIMDWLQELLATPSLLRDGPKDSFLDRVFVNNVNVLVAKTKEAYKAIKYHDAMKFGFFELWAARDAYRANLEVPMHRELTMWFLEVSVIMLS